MQSEVYIGTAEERAEGDMGDDTACVPVGVGHGQASWIG